MWQQTNIIKWTFAFALLFLVITYFVSVNAERGIIIANSGWVSNDFFFTIFGGAFASCLVVLLIEYYRYLALKVSNEQTLYFHGAFLYRSLLSMKKTAENYSMNPEQLVPNNLFDMFVSTIDGECRILESTEYVLLKNSKNPLVTEHKRIQSSLRRKVQPVLNADKELKIAINETQIQILERDRKNGTFSSSLSTCSKDPLIHELLIKKIPEIEDVLDYIDNYMDVIDKTCGKQTDWKCLRKSLLDEIGR